jgi:hypothetical protein
VADAPTWDFRASTRKEQALKVSGGKVSAEVKAPASGCRVFLADLEYETDGIAYYLSTQLRIVGKPAG